jgi:predicted acyltransferase
MQKKLYLFFLTFFAFLFPGIPLNKSLYTISYMLLSSAASGLTFMALYVLVSIVTIETFFLCN